jgi:hypothetical protein
MFMKIFNPHTLLRVLCFLVSILELQMARADDTTTNSVPVGPAQTNPPPQPGYQQTVDWIQSKIKQCGFVDTVKGDNDWILDMSIDNGVLRFTENWESKHLNSFVQYEMQKFSESIILSKVSDITVAQDDRISPGAWVLTFTTPTQSITHTYSTHAVTGNSQNPSLDSSGTSNEKSARLIFGQLNSDHEDIALRMKNAFENLVRICKETASKSNEPF